MRLIGRVLIIRVLAPLFGQTTINVSQDLVRLGIAGTNMTPNQPNLDSAPLLNPTVNYAQLRQGTKIVADSGAYYS